MTVKRYFAETARECLRRVKVDIGPDAIVVSNRAVEGGVEIMAMSADSLNALSQQPAPPRAQLNAATHAAAAAAVRAPARAEPQRTATASRPPVASEDDYTVSLSAKAHSPSKPGSRQRSSRLCSAKRRRNVRRCVRCRASRYPAETRLRQVSIASSVKPVGAMPVGRRLRS